MTDETIFSLTHCFAILTERVKNKTKELKDDKVFEMMSKVIQQNESSDKNQKILEMALSQKLKFETLFLEQNEQLQIIETEMAKLRAVIQNVKTESVSVQQKIDYFVDRCVDIEARKREMEIAKVDENFYNQKIILEKFRSEKSHQIEKDKKNKNDERLSFCQIESGRTNEHLDAPKKDEKVLGNEQNSANGVIHTSEQENGQLPLVIKTDCLCGTEILATRPESDDEEDPYDETNYVIENRPKTFFIPEEFRESKCKVVERPTQVALVPKEVPNEIEVDCCFENVIKWTSFTKSEIIFQSRSIKENIKTVFLEKICGVPNVCVIITDDKENEFGAFFEKALDTEKDVGVDKKHFLFISKKSGVFFTTLIKQKVNGVGLGVDLFNSNELFYIGNNSFHFVSVSIDEKGAAYSLPTIYQVDDYWLNGTQETPFAVKSIVVARLY
ncbi:hypothetical protein EIN_274320 [Entamoeba invadens IP1]|uniref:TLDc domain-containing protein n=1 Tax=Entamoeba invadens IP1 TaxID=370355 RepID=A0A0A1U1G3_ENTIV|nr:hypothetical protein EIN_274320 [Entamoeba invadens IP1]ELP87865.1 hypothetical protein EIN_274320 [Entamoeba invadens IP1]|eukprot:XP_004254636.1 hypothetical protein EIN_274320 [Entamoeba invadens IP1]